MEILREIVPESTLQQFADKHGLKLKMVERAADLRERGLPRYYCHLVDPKNHHFSCDTVEGHFLHGKSGNGETETEAITDYRSIVSEKTMRIGRADIEVPRLVPGAE